MEFLASEHRAMAYVQVLGDEGALSDRVPVVGQDFPVVGVQNFVSVASLYYCPPSSGRS